MDDVQTQVRIDEYLEGVRQHLENKRLRYQEWLALTPDKIPASDWI